MAQIVICDQCQAEPAMLLATMNPNGEAVTVGVGPECMEGFLTWQLSILAGITGAPEADVLAHEAFDAQYAADTAGEAPEPGETATGVSDEADEADLESVGRGEDSDYLAPAGFPGTANVKKSTHGHRAGRAGT